MENTLQAKIQLELLKLFPKKAFSMVLRKWASLKLPGPVRRVQSQVFSKLVELNEDEAERSVGSYNSLDALFTRRLKEGVRLIDANPRVIVSPADGRLESTGTIQKETLIQAKGLEYELGDLLMDREKADQFIDGGYITVYLSPHDYHRVHFPIGGEVVTYRHIPGEFFPVGNFSRTNVPRLYARNERVVTYIQTEHGLVAIIMVAAMGVGNMTLSFVGMQPSPGDNQGTGASVLRNKGDELGIFHLGSTVVMLFEAGAMTPEAIEEGSLVSMGSPLATWR